MTLTLASTAPHRPVRLLQGHVIPVLRGLPAASVHCAVTSPPYWKQRLYGGGEQVWAASPEGESCAHEWGEAQPASRARWGNLDTLSVKQKSNRGSAANVAALEASSGAFCRACGAWRGELGQEPSVRLFVAHLVAIFQEVRRVLRPDGCLWLNLGDSFFGDSPVRSRSGEGFSAMWDPNQTASRGGPRRSAAVTEDGLRRKDLCGVPWRTAIALQEDGWWLRADCIFHKRNCMTESVTDRPNVKDKEYVFLLTPTPHNYFDMEAVKEVASSAREARWDNGENGHGGGVSHRGQGGSTRKFGPDPARRHLRSVWTMTVKGTRGAHTSTFPEELPERCILGSTSEHGVCGLCFAPYERVTEKGAADPAWQKACGGDAQGEYAGTAVKDYAATRAQDASATKARILKSLRPNVTTGWRPTCDCHALMAGPVVPATVLDPFCGSGTTGIVARRLGRDFIGIDLKESYLDLARERFEKDGAK